jgi:ribonuclease BN (tRNA processing enzyme)
MAEDVSRDGRVTVTIIGCGSPHPDPGRFGSAVAVAAGGTTILIDCGPATVYKMLRYGLHPRDVSALLITHHHFDHTSDLPTFGLTRWESNVGAQAPLFVAGPSGTRRLVDGLFGPEGVFRPDVVARRESPLSQAKVRMLGGILPRPDLETQVAEYGPGETFVMPCGWSVETALAQHVEPLHHSIGFRVTIGGVVVVVTGDSERNSELTHLARGADLVVAMCGDEERLMRARNLTSGQMGTESAATLARDAGAKGLVLTHTNTRVARSPNRERAVGQVAAIFSGDVYFSEEGLSIVLPRDGR